MNNNRLRCIIVDDEPLARELIGSYVRKTPGLELVGEFESADDALGCIRRSAVDLVFLDINMPMINGIDFAALIPAETRIIYITAYEQFALQGFRVNALDYLLKPVSYGDFADAVGKAIEWHAMHRAYTSSEASDTSVVSAKNVDAIMIKSENRLVRIKTDTIQYVEVLNDRTIVHRNDGEPVASLMSMREIEEMLPDDRFMRVHRSFLVNLSAVRVIERSHIIFGKTRIPVSDLRRDEFFARLS